MDKEEAKKIALDILKKVNPPSLADFLAIHSEKVGSLAKIIAQKLEVDSGVLEIAGWIHDIGYSKSVENHAEYAIPVLRKLGYEADEILEDCILNHGNGKNPKTIEGKIFQIADKLSIFDLDTIESMLKHGTFPLKKDDVGILKKMSEKSFELVENFNK